MPVRSCVVCSEPQPKRSLIRLVCGSQNRVVIDTDSKMAGRGAYLCHNQAHWSSALNRDTLARALKTVVDHQSKTSLLAQLTRLGSQTK